MSSAENITSQFSGVIPGMVTGQNAVAKTYVDAELAQRDDEISTVSVSAAVAQSTIDLHKSSATAHPAESILYTGLVEEAANVKQAIDIQKQRMDNIVESGGNSNIEIVDARGEYSLLRYRLEDNDAKLAERATKADLETTNWNLSIFRNETDTKLLSKRGKTEKINSSDLDTSSDANKIKLINLSEEVQQAMAGTAPVISTVADGSLTTEKYANTSITMEKLKDGSFFGILSNATGQLINFDFVNKKITIPKNSYVTNGSTQYFYNATEDLVLDFSSFAQYSGGERTLAYDLINNTFVIERRTMSSLKKMIVIATWWGGDTGDSLVCPFPHLVNGKKVDNYGLSFDSQNITLDKMSRHGNLAMISNATNAFINFDFSTKTITIPRHSFLTCGGKRVFYNGDNAITVDWSNVGAGERSLIFDLENSTFKVIANQLGTLTKNSLLAAIWWGLDDPLSLVCFSPYTVNGKKVDRYNTDLSEYALKNEVGLFNFDENLNYPLYNTELYLTEKLKLPMFLDSVFLNTSESGIRQLNPTIVYADRNGVTKMSEGITPIIQGEDFNGNTLSIRYKNNILSTHYEKPLTIKYKKHVDITKTTPKVLMIGDSLIEWGTPTFTKNILEMIGLSPTMLGTHMDYFNTTSEGRGSWTWTNYIARSTKRGINDIAITQATGTTSNANSCPFWKVATETDKTNHPEWCFKYVAKEHNNLNYTEAIDKTGTFYIFDMEYYLSKLGGQVPDVITINLGTNDLNLDHLWDKDVYDLMDLSIDIMVSQIRKALPTTPIVIIPVPAKGDIGHSNWNDNHKFVKWYKRCIEKINSLSDEYTKALSMYAHMSKNYFWGTSDETLTNGIIKHTNGDVIHFRESGQKQYSEALANCIVNLI